MSNENANKSLNQSHNESGAGGRYPTIIPMSRVRTIMKSSPEITNINQDTLFLVCKATVNCVLFNMILFYQKSIFYIINKELFIRHFCKEAYKNSNKDPNLDYDKLASLVAKDEKFQFLSGILIQFA